MLRMTEQRTTPIYSHRMQRAALGRLFSRGPGGEKEHTRSIRFLHGAAGIATILELIEDLRPVIGIYKYIRNSELIGKRAEP